MAKLSIVFCVLAAIASGCATQAVLTDDQVRAEFVQDFGDVIAVRILADKAPAAEAQRITRVATKVRAAAADDVTAGDLRSLLVREAIKQLDEDDQPRAEMIVDLIARRIKRRFGIDLTIVPADRFTEVRRLIIDLCDVTIEVAEPYAAAK